MPYKLANKIRKMFIIWKNVRVPQSFFLSFPTFQNEGKVEGECADINRPFDSEDQLDSKQLRFSSHSDLIGEDYISLSGQNLCQRAKCQLST